MLKAVKAATGHPTPPPNILVPDIRAEEIQADRVYVSCCEMQYDAV